MTKIVVFDNEISTHTPTRDATYESETIKTLSLISIHTSAQDATSDAYAVSF